MCWERLQKVRPAEGAWSWLAFGIGLVLVTSFARLRWQWWPLHPVAFLLWGTYPNAEFAASFLLGWLVKVTTINTTGARGYQVLKPLMIGVIAGELLAGLLWMAVGAAYYFMTGHVPAKYSVLPG